MLETLIEAKAEGEERSQMREPPEAPSSQGEVVVQRPKRKAHFLRVLRPGGHTHFQNHLRKRQPQIAKCPWTL